MKTVKFFFGALALAVVSMVASPVANAQEEETVRGPYLTNTKFIDNTFINGNIGLNVGRDGKTVTGLALDGSLGKWFTPTVGARVGLNGLSGSAPDGGKYLYAHADAMWNISNAIGGYRADRFWDFVPYAHTGVFVDPSQVGLEFAAGAGLHNIVRIFKNAENWLNRVNATVDVRGTIYRGDYIAGVASITAGLTYNFGKTTWTRASEYSNPADLDKITAAEAAAAALTAANAALAADKAQLEKEKAAIQTQSAALVAEAKKEAESGLQNVAPASFYFEIGKTELNDKELAHLDFYMQNVLPYVKNVKATVVTGTADSNTGYAKRNEYLSKKRAEYMVNLLKTKYGIDTANVVVKNQVVKAASKAQLDRAAVISFE